MNVFIKSDTCTVLYVVIMNEKYLIVANLGTREERARVDVARYGMRKLKCQTSDDNSLLESSDGIHFIDIPRLWIKVYKVENNAR